MNCRQQQLLAVDLFSGCGGLTLGLKQAGFRVLGAVDVDALSVETYRVNHPDVKVWQHDIRSLPVSQLRRAFGLVTGQLDLLAGCPPCQGFSTMRTLNGKRKIEDCRNDLVFEYLRYVKELQPKAIMMENVPGLATDIRMTVLRDELRLLGYESICEVLNAADFGVPQRRRRMILLAAKEGAPTTAEREERRRTVRDAIADLPKPGNSGDPLHDLTEKRSERVAELISKIPKDGGSRMDLGADEQLTCHRNCDGFKDVYGRMAWDQVSPTITSGCFNPSKGRFLHPEQDRAITLREAALLQTFPPDYSFSLRRGKSGAALLIGNALPPEFIRRMAERIADQLRERVINVV